MAKSALEQYRIDRGLTYEELGTLLDTSRQNARRWCDGVEPRLSDRKKIEKRTKGQVKCGPVLIYD